VADDDESVHRAARSAATTAERKLAQSRTNLDSAAAAFKGPVGLSWGTVGEKLNKSKTCASQYKELQSAIRTAQNAVERADAACKALKNAIQP
jgi:hypothetical protein